MIMSYLTVSGPVVTLAMSCVLSISYGPVHAQEQPQSTASLPVRGLCAHRAAMASHPENTLPAIREAIRVGAHMIELDVRLTRDGVPVLMHDDTVDRTTDGTGPVTDLTFAEVRALDAGAWKSPLFRGSRVPTLVEALSVFPANIWVDLDMKGGYELGVVVGRLVASMEMTDQVVLACGDLSSARGAKEVAPDILIDNMDRRDITREYVDATIAMKADFIQLRGPWRDEFSGWIRDLHEHGIRVIYTSSPYTDEEVRLALAGGVEFPLTNTISSTIIHAEDWDIKPVTAEW
jgi:glycerophosphoryl diester phosphodiesterase